MKLLTHNTEPSLSTGKCAPEHGAGRLKAFGSGADLRLYTDLLVSTSELHLPVHSIARKRTKRIVQAGVFPYVSRFLHGHGFGVKPTPGGRLVLLLRLAPPSVTVSICDGPSVNAELRPWESDPLARLRQV
jgi:hypothetical protein